MPAGLARYTLHIRPKAGRDRHVRAGNLSRIAVIMACAVIRRHNATSSMAELLPAPLAGAVVEGPDADEDADVAHIAPEVIVVVVVVVNAVVVAVANTPPPMLRESHTTQTTSTPLRFWPLRHLTTTTLSSTLTQSIPLAGQMATTRVLMTAFPKMMLATAPS